MATMLVGLLTDIVGKLIRILTGTPLLESVVPTYGVHFRLFCGGVRVVRQKVLLTCWSSTHLLGAATQSASAVRAVLVPVSRRC